MSTTTPDADLRCPQCAAHVRTGSDWCTLCYADLRPAPEPAAVAEPAAPEVPTADVLPAVDLPSGAAADLPAADPAPEAAPASRGKHAKHSSRPSVEETEALAAQLLAQLAVTESGSPLGRVSALTDSTGKKVGLMIGGAAALMLLIFALMAILGAFL